MNVFARQVTVWELACLTIMLRQVCAWGCVFVVCCLNCARHVSWLAIYIDHEVASSMCLGLFFCSLLFKLCSSSDSVGVGLQIHLWESP